MSIEDRVAKLEELILRRLVVNKEGCLEKMLLSQGNSEEQILDMQKQMIDYIEYRGNWISDFKAYLENSWFDRSGDTDGIAIGSGNEIKYANADDFESKNPSLFQKMYNHWISNPDDTFGTDSSFSWESKARNRNE